MREPPPDLSSFLMQQRIVYLGLPLQSSVTELLIAEFMYLNSHAPDKPVSFHTSTPPGSSKDGDGQPFCGLGHFGPESECRANAGRSGQRPSGVGRVKNAGKFAAGV